MRIFIDGLCYSHIFCSQRLLRSYSISMEIIEDYPDDKYSPSSLLLGFTYARRALHIQVSRIDSDMLKIITLYEPDLIQWINYRERTG